MFSDCAGGVTLWLPFLLSSSFGKESPSFRLEMMEISCSSVNSGMVLGAGSAKAGYRSRAWSDWVRGVHFAKRSF